MSLWKIVCCWTQTLWTVRVSPKKYDYQTFTKICNQDYDIGICHSSVVIPLEIYAVKLSLWCKEKIFRLAAIQSKIPLLKTASSDMAMTIGIAPRLELVLTETVLNQLQTKPTFNFVKKNKMSKEGQMVLNEKLYKEVEVPL